MDGVLWQNLGTVTVDEWGSVTLTLIRTGNDPTKAIALDEIKLTPHEAEVNYGWDIKGRLLQVVAKDAAGDVVTDVSMGYDYAGRKTFRHDALSGAADRVYVHDGLNTGSARPRLVNRQSRGSMEPGSMRSNRSRNA